MKRAAIGAIVFSLGLAGCQQGRTYVLNSPEAAMAYSSVVVREGPSNVPLDPALRAEFEQALAAELGTPDGAHGNDPLTLEYRVILHDPGSTGTRVGAAIVSVIGVPTGALGMGTVGVAVTYRGQDGRELATILADGPIDGPGGSTRGGLKTAATSIGRYTKMNFPTGGQVVTASAGSIRGGATATP